MPSKTVTPDLQKKIAQESPKVSQAITALRRLGMSRTAILALARKAMDVAESK